MSKLYVLFMILGLAVAIPVADTDTAYAGGYSDKDDDNEAPAPDPAPDPAPEPESAALNESSNLGGGEPRLVNQQFSGNRVDHTFPGTVAFRVRCGFQRLLSFGYDTDTCQTSERERFEKYSVEFFRGVGLVRD